MTCMDPRHVAPCYLIHLMTYLLLLLLLPLSQLHQPPPHCLKSQAHSSRRVFAIPCAWSVPSFPISAWSTLFGSLLKCHLLSKPFIVTLSKIRCFHFSISLLCFTFWHIISYNTLFIYIIYIVYYLSPPVEFKLQKGRNLFFVFMFCILAHVSAQ